MSGIEVIGLISAIIGIVDSASKLYKAIQDTSGLPEAFSRVADHLPLVRDTLQTIKMRLEQTAADDSGWIAIKRTLESCSNKAERLWNVLDEVAAQPDDSRLQRYRLAIRRLGKESKLEELAKNMLEDVQLLAANQAVRTAAENKLGPLMEAIKDLSRVRDSAPTGPSFSHSGNGDQINNTGSGILYLNKGKGQIYAATTQTFGTK